MFAIRNYIEPRRELILNRNGHGIINQLGAVVGSEVGEVSTAPPTAKSVVSYGVGAKAVAEALAEQLGVVAVSNEQAAAE